MYGVRIVDSDFNRLLNEVFDDAYEPKNTIKQSICSSNFPPSNISFDTTNESYILELALAGYTEDDLSVDYADGYIKVSGKKPKELENRRYAKTGIKLADEFETCYGIDIAKYDISKLKATMNNGILMIVVPVLKSFIKSKTFAINGKVRDKQALPESEETKQ